MWRLERRWIFMSGFRCLREIESALFNCWDRGFLSPGTLLPVGHDVGFEKDFVDFAKLRFLRQPRLPDFLWQLLQPWASKFALLGNQPWGTTMAVVFNPVSVINVIQYFILNLPTPAALSTQPIITSWMQKGFHAGYPKVNSALLAMVLTNSDRTLWLA